MKRLEEFRDPICVSGTLIEKSDLDGWIRDLRSYEREKFEGMLMLSRSDTDAMLENFEKTLEANFYMTFDVKIRISKIIRYFDGQPYVYPAIINL
jgi:hypothetical protein